MPAEVLHARLRMRPIDHTARRHILVADSDGRTRSFGGGKPPVESVAGYEYFERHRASSERGPLVSAPFRAHADGRWRLPISMRIDRADGGFGGIAVTTLDGEYLARYFDALDLIQDGAIALISSRGQFLSRHPPAGPENEALAAHVGQLLRGTEGPIAALSPVDGLERMGWYRRLGDHAVYLVVTYSRDQVLASWKRNAILRTLGGCAVLLATGIFTFLLLRRLAEERVAAANLAKFRRAVDLSGDMIYWLDERGRILYANDSAARRLGVDPRRLPPDLTIHKLSAQFSEARWNALSDVLKRRGEVSYESEHAAADGTRYPVHVSATYLEANGNGLGFLICRDLSEQKRNEAEIRELATSLEERVKSRTAELDETNRELESFVHSVSHDLRAPLNHLTAYSEELSGEAAAGNLAEARKYAGRIAERAAYMGELIDALLTLSRVTRVALEQRDVDLSALAFEIDAEHRKLEPGREVETIVEPGLLAQGDPVLLRTLLENLIGNAWKYTSLRQRARIEFRAEVVDGVRAFVVRDNGAGFDPRYAGRLFGVFQRLHSQQEFKGTGVGLATCRRIVARHGGRIWAEARPDGGATFRFTLD
jgi:PAS domain S-box-containing protein